jgi:hypothetical protein
MPHDLSPHSDHCTACGAPAWVPECVPSTDDDAEAIRDVWAAWEAVDPRPRTDTRVKSQ